MADGMSNVLEGELLNWAKTTNYNGPIGITVKFPVKDSEVSNFQTIYQKNHDFAKSQEGCKVFKMNQDFKSQSCFWLIEEWDSIAAWKTYLLSDERSAKANALMPMMEEPPHLAVYKIVSRFLKDHSGGMSNVVEGELINWAKTTDYNGPIGITVKFLVKDSEVSNFQTIYQKNHDFAKSQEGCKVFKMNQDFKSQSCFWLVEEWDSITAWKTYLLSDERSAKAKALMPMMEEPPHLAVYKIVSRFLKDHSGGMSNVVEGELINWAKTTDYNGPIGITVKFLVKDSEVSNFQTIYQKNHDFAKSQEGCKVFKMNQDFKSQSCFWLVEEWDSITAWKTYLLSDERSAKAKALMPMMEEPPHLAVYKIVSRFLKKDHSGGMSNVEEGELMNWAKTTDYNGPIGITVKFPVKDSEVSNFQTIYQKNHDFAKSQEGCKVFKMNQDFKSQSCFWLVEEWDSIAAWKTYLLSDVRSANAKALMPMMEEPPHLAVYKVES